MRETVLDLGSTSIPYQGHIDWTVDQTNKIDENLHTHYRVFLEDNKLSGKYGWDFTEKEYE